MLAFVSPSGLALAQFVLGIVTTSLMTRSHRPSASYLLGRLELFNDVQIQMAIEAAKLETRRRTVEGVAERFALDIGRGVES
jgi:hypothetical protein